MDTNKLAEELNFVGKIKKINWFNDSLLNKPWLIDLISDVLNKKSTTIRNILYSLFPIVEYLFSRNTQSDGKYIFDSKNQWSDFVKENLEIIVAMIIDFGTQGNIPQRAAIILDYINRKDCISNEKNIVIELGCSSGLLGCVFENVKKLFTDDNQEIAKKYFWLKRIPLIKYPDAEFLYLGYDRNVPPKQLIPFYIWDQEKREKVKNFAKDFTLKGIIIEQEIEHFFRFQKLFGSSPIIILTSFVLYHLPNPEFIIKNIQKKVKTNIHWLDISRNKDLPSIFHNQKTFRKNWIYLSDNAKPVAEIRNGSDDCPDWEYLND